MFLLPICIPGVAIGQTGPVRSHRSVPASHASPAPGGVTRVVMQNVDFYVDPNVVLHIRRLRGAMRSRTGGTIVFDDKRSFIIHIDSADVGLNGNDLTALMNRYVFGYRGAPITHMTVTITGGEMRMTGRLHKGVSIPFDIRAQVSATPNGMMRIHPVQTKIFHLNGDALMHALGLSLQKLIDVRKATGVVVQGNDIVVDPAKVLPPPAIEGHVSRVRVDGDEIVQTFSTAAGRAAQPRSVPPDTSAHNYMYYRGGSIRFGRLTMDNAEMQIVDLDPSDPFRFDLDRYAGQLIAGYSRTLPDMGLEVFMRDVDKLGKRPGTMNRPLRRHAGE